MSGSETSLNSINSLEYVAPEYRVTVRLLELMQKTDYQLVQENGQRRLTAPEIISGKCVRVKGAEVFIGRLPRDCYEDELMPVLEKIGRLMELRMMLDFSGSNRGYAFALYEDSKTARRACELLDGYEIRLEHRIGVVKSIDNCRLFFGGVPKDKTKQEFMTELTKMLDGIVDVYLYPNAQDRSLNRGFIFVEFKDHRSAAMARRKLIPGRVVLWNHEIAVDWADPEPGDPIDEEVMETVTALFIRNLSLNTTQQQVKELMQKNTKIPILKLKKINHFAFVHYETRELAEKVLNILNQPGGVADKNQWEIRWAKPIGTIKSSERQRCINEAYAKTHDKDSNIKQQIFKKKRSKNFDENNQRPSVKCSYTTVPCTAVLENLVVNSLQAHGYIEILQSFEPAGYICRVLIVKENCIIFEYYGNVMPSKHEAISTTVHTVYEILKYQVDDSANIPIPTMPNVYSDKLMTPFPADVQASWMKSF